MIRATILLYPQAMASSIGLAMEMLSAADDFQSRGKPAKSTLSLQVAAIEKRSIQTTGGLSIRPDCHIQDISESDLVVLPALWRNPQRVIQSQREILDWLHRIKRQDNMICAVGTASCFLAEAGLLDNKPATTHWYYFDEFERRYPKVQLQRRHLITQAGLMFCAGSVNSVADLMVHFITRFYGQGIARKVEAQFSPEIRQSYDSHFYSDSRPASHHDEDIIAAQHWLSANFDKEISIQALAGRVGLSTRSFNRRFKIATGETPLAYLQKIRIKTAKELLQDSNLTIAEIADKIGYSDCSYFSALFKKQMSQSPNTYRQRVRGKLFNAEQGDFF